MAGAGTMGLCLYVWNPWQTRGQVYYPYIQDLPKNNYKSIRVLATWRCIHTWC
jgi:hypothetical protein